MNNAGRELTGFASNGSPHKRMRGDGERRLADVAPDVARKHAGRVNGTWFPVIQAFEVATGISRSELISRTASRHLASLGFEVTGSVEPRSPQPLVGSASTLL